MTSPLASGLDLLTAGPDADQAIAALVRRMELWPQLLRRQQEELITALVPIEPSWLQQQRQVFLGDEPLDQVLTRHRWLEADLDLHLARPEALRRFAEERFGPGLEEAFMAAQGGHDQIIYSLLRVRDGGLARELWIRLEEGEATFAELASSFGEGPEAARKGVIGPVPIGSIAPPELAQLLRTLQPGEVHPPRQLGEWLVLLRLEQLTPARFDAAMRTFLLDQQLDAFLEGRVQQVLRGEHPDDLQYDPRS
jgi:hypothetical protein